ncbi:hypothetical protein [Tardiphaga robiniae]|uniref:Uncharacterized protein n=1 Tax=Tardiphaga robiniae TaxID=943830 RepID=A0A7G6TVN4_9BRAD|nr:hypothetical protein [Tardiphaga robiniae]QND70816.1 hypothetical protein HB776_05885 [Tardiphaga robiniae]
MKEAKPTKAKSLLELLQPLLAIPADEIFIVKNGTYQHLEEGKWIAGDFPNEIRIDRNTHMRTGEKHAHIHDRKGNERYAVTFDAKPSHGTKSFRLSDGQADALRKEGFNIPKNRIVEASLIWSGPTIEYG